MHPTAIIKTDDGSDTLFVDSLQENYHSRFGAQSESEHVFLQAGFRHPVGLTSRCILEIGFGTGLNCLLTALEASKSGVNTLYYAIEKYPLDQLLVNKMHFPAKEDELSNALFHEIHSAPWEKIMPLTNWFQLMKIEWDFVTGLPEELPMFDLVYFDAFSPDKQPEMWNSSLLSKIAEKVSTGGIFVTYCAKGSVRRDLVKAGFKMERIPGPVGKREMLRGIKV
jgi:tRNA U34 5-methylaminomethyl-2-thiouridine-forming methyltransferase MnmC